MVTDSGEHSVPIIKRPTPPPPPPVPSRVSAQPAGNPVVPMSEPAAVVPVAAPVALVQPAPVPAAQVDVSQVAIRTMRDDMVTAKSGKVLARPLSRVATVLPAAAASQFPLPPRQASPSTKTITAPVLARPRRKGVWVAVSSLLALIMVIAGGIAAWLWLFDGAVPGGVQPTTVVADVAKLVPTNYSALVRYDLTNAADREAITNRWQAARGKTVTAKELLTGDPRLLLTDSELAELYYVLLEDAGDPFLLVPKTAATSAALVQSGEAKYVERDGWYIAHRLSVEPFVAALAEGTLGTGALPTELATAGLAPLRVSIGAGLLPALRTGIAGKAYEAGQLQELNFVAQLAAVTDGVQLAGSAKRFTALTTGLATQTLLDLIPAQASFVRLGANFKEDVKNWLAVGGVLDGASLATPATAALFEQLSTSYAWFSYPAAQQASSAVGVVIELPPGLQGKLTLADAALEQGVNALVPMVTGRPALAPLVFTQASYGTVPLRFANSSGSNQAIDYAVTDRHLLIATSKDSMLGLIDTVTAKVPAWTTTEPWQGLVAQWGALPPARDFIFGRLPIASLLQVLPTAVNTPVAMGVAVTPVAGEAGTATTQLTGVLQLQTAPLIASPSPGL